MPTKADKEPRKSAKRLQILSLRVSDEMLDELRAAAAKEMRAVSNLAVLMIAEGLERRRGVKRAKADET